MNERAKRAERFRNTAWLGPGNMVCPAELTKIREEALCACIRAMALQGTLITLLVALAVVGYTRWRLTSAVSLLYAWWRRRSMIDRPEETGRWLTRRKCIIIFTILCVVICAVVEYMVISRANPWDTYTLTWTPPLLHGAAWLTVVTHVNFVEQLPMIYWRRPTIF